MTLFDYICITRCQWSDKLSISKLYYYYTIVVWTAVCCSLACCFSAVLSEARRYVRSALFLMLARYIVRAVRTIE